MTLIEALKSGKPFKRPSQLNSNQWFVVLHNNQSRIGVRSFFTCPDTHADSYFTYGFDSESILADDWELYKDPCKHEPKNSSNWVLSTGGLVSIDCYKKLELLISSPVCKHCGVKIKAKEWVEE